MELPIHRLLNKKKLTGSEEILRNLRALPAPRVSRDQRHRVIPYRVHDGVELGGDREFALVFREFNELCERSALMEIFVMCEHRSVLVDRRDRESFVSCDSFEFRLGCGEYRGVDLVPRVVPGRQVQGM